jgi:uncharacterized protein YjbI with pentapeptide repeats
MNQIDLNLLLENHALTWIEPEDPDAIPGGQRLEIDDQDLAGLDFSGRDMRSCRLVRCNLQGANFQGADISHAELMGSDLRGANMDVAADAGTDYTGCTR